MTMTSQFADMTSCLGTGLSFMSISSLVLELWKFSFIMDWPEIRKSEIPLSKFRPISGDWGELGIPNLARICLMKYYWMLQNAKVTSFTVSVLLRENQQGGKTTPPPRLGLTRVFLRSLIDSSLQGLIQAVFDIGIPI